MIEIEMKEMNERKAHKPRAKINIEIQNEHDKYKEGRLAQISNSRTITMTWFAVFHQLAKVGDS